MGKTRDLAEELKADPMFRDLPFVEQLAKLHDTNFDDFLKMTEGKTVDTMEADLLKRRDTIATHFTQLGALPSQFEEEVSDAFMEATGRSHDWGLNDNGTDPLEQPRLGGRFSPAKKRINSTL